MLDRRDMLSLSILAGAATAAPSVAATLAGGDPGHDFDFLIGSWRVKHRRLKERLTGSNDWQEFDGRCVMQPVLGGVGNIDDNWLDIPGGAYRAVTLRSYDPKTRLWAIWWLDGRNPHTLDVPVKGSFENGLGTFFADDTLRGQPVKLRFLWSAITATSAEWRQALSADGGKTWETNWIMHFARVT
ncbi:MAG: DUF1579 domain-containing protein [Pseudomonadota bacterium]|uniref:DUF1579 domain-containing protein n=1 Tax=Sphingomonas sp. ERG5 TaxID=1381597 RepID=UPI000A8D4479|nr:DUF1579 domain-containing protein [Sphingomonas sp. ERG5]